MRRMVVMQAYVGGGLVPAAPPRKLTPGPRAGNHHIVGEPKPILTSAYISYSALYSFLSSIGISTTF